MKKYVRKEERINGRRYFDIVYGTKINKEKKGRERCIRRRNVMKKYVRKEERINERRYFDIVYETKINKEIREEKDV
jgi:hypothetical protein